MRNFTSAELVLLEQGLARVHRGRLVPVMRGGSGIETEAPAAEAPAAVEPPPVEPAPVVEPVVEAPPALSREDLIAATREGSSEAFRAFAEAEARREAASRPAPTLPEWDPYDPNVVVQHTLAAFAPIMQQLEEKANRGATVAETYERQQGEVEARALLDGLKAGENKLPDFDNDRVIAAAKVRLWSGEETSPEKALRDAAAAEVAHNAARDAEVLKRYGIVAQNHVNVTAEPAAGAAAAAEVSTLPRGPKAYDIQLRRSLEASGARPGTAVPTG